MDLKQWAKYVSSALQQPPTSFQLTRLTGGVCNSTVRLVYFPVPVESASLSDISRIPNDLSYMALEPDSPLSQFRQVAEARALLHLAQDAALRKALKDSGVSVPKLIWHDKENHVLWISDLGDLRNLIDYLKALDAKEAPQPLRAELLQANHQHAMSAGRRFGVVLGRLHIAGKSPSADLVSGFIDPDPQPGTPDIADLCQGTTVRMLSEYGYEDALELSTRIGLTISSPAIDGLSVWSMIDIWPGSVLLGSSDSRDAASSNQVPDILGEITRMSLVDWEFAGACHPGADIGMFLSHLAQHKAMALHPRPDRVGPSDLAGTRTDAFAQGFASGYLGSAESLVRSPSFMREVLKSYGREQVTAGDFMKEVVNDEGRSRLVRGGASALRAAGGTEADLDLGTLRSIDVEYLLPFFNALSLCTS